jgi:DNA-binding NtrC family response regulator
MSRSPPFPPQNRPTSGPPRTPTHPNIWQPIRNAPDGPSAGRAFLRILAGAATRFMQHQPSGSQLEIHPALVLRAMLHLKREHGYIQLIAIGRKDSDGGKATNEELSLNFAASSTALRAIEQQGCAIVLEAGPSGSENGVSLSGQTLSELRARATTHLLAFPFRGPANTSGMVSIELGCPGLQGKGTSHFEGLREYLEGLIGEGSKAFSGSLTSLAPKEWVTDERLPVVGTTMRPIVETLRRFAATEEHIHLFGETGTGKTLMAAWIHAQSPRANRPFVSLQAQAVPPDLLEAELFGVKRGAYTGATSDRPGLVDAANGGTLFIDELHRLPLSTQSRLLRFLDERKYRRVGEPEVERTANLRLIVASADDLRQATRDGDFLPDLYYRVAGLPVRLPPLRERTDEVEAWVSYFLQQACARQGRPNPPAIRPESWAALKAHTWPGNLRELQRLVGRALALQGPELDLLPIEEPAADASKSTGPLAEHHLAADIAELLVRMTGAADAFATLLQATSKDPNQAQLHHALREAGEVFRAAVLMQLASRLDVREAALCFGMDRMVQQRNHTAAFRRENARLSEFREILELSTRQR